MEQKISVRIGLCSENQQKLNDFIKVFRHTEPIKINVPEIQGTEREIIEDKLVKSVKILREEKKELYDSIDAIVVEDTSLSFENTKYTFPGPYIKYFYKSFGPKQIIQRFGREKVLVTSSIGCFTKMGIFFVTGEQYAYICNGFDEFLPPDQYDNFNCVVTTNLDSFLGPIVNSFSRKPETRTFRLDAVTRLQEKLEELIKKNK